MSGGFDITSDVSFVLITGNPGGGKTAVSKILFCNLPEDWRLIDLDDFLFVRLTSQGSFSWDLYEESHAVRASAFRFYAMNHAKVLAEGIVQSDREVSAYCKAMGLTPDSQRFRFIDLRCNEAEAVRRMTFRPIHEDGGWNHESHYHGLSGRLRATGAIRVQTDGKTREDVAREVIGIANRPRADPAT